MQDKEKAADDDKAQVKDITVELKKHGRPHGTPHPEFLGHGQRHHLQRR